MKNKIVIVLMLALLALNFYSWNKITIENHKNIEQIAKTLSTCNVNK